MASLSTSLLGFCIAWQLNLVKLKWLLHKDYALWRHHWPSHCVYCRCWLRVNRWDGKLMTSAREPSLTTGRRECHASTTSWNRSRAMMSRSCLVCSRWHAQRLSRFTHFHSLSMINVKNSFVMNSTIEDNIKTRKQDNRASGLSTVFQFSFCENAYQISMLVWPFGFEHESDKKVCALKTTVDFFAQLRQCFLLLLEMAGVGSTHHGCGKRSKGQCQVSVHAREVHRPSLQQWPCEYHLYEQSQCTCSYVQWWVYVMRTVTVHCVLFLRTVVCCFRYNWNNTKSVK